MGQQKKLLVALDIGTSKVVALVAQRTANSTLEIIGVGTHPSRGLKRGVVVNIESTVQSIQEALSKAEAIAGCQITAAYTGIAGSHINCVNSYGTVPINEQEVTHHDIERVIESARAVPIPTDQRILHILPQEFVIDNQQGIRDPIGMSGVRLEAKVHMVLGSAAAAQNIATCVQRCGLEVGGIILEQVASSHAVLFEDERESGVCMIDIGAGTTDIAVFINDAIQYTCAIPLAGDQVTSDIALTLHVPLQTAESLKVEYGAARANQINSGDMVQCAATDDRAARKISRKYLSNIIEARYTELFELIAERLENLKLDRNLACGIVLTGGGAKLPQLVELAESIFRMPVRLGSARGCVEGFEEKLSDPVYATGIGLLLYAENQRKRMNEIHELSGKTMKGVWQRMANWFRGNF